MLAIVEIPQRTLPEQSTLILVAVGIEKPGNLGAMARTADAAGADALLVADAQSDPWNPNAIRASTGAVFTLPIVEATRRRGRTRSHPTGSPPSSAPHDRTPMPDLTATDRAHRRRRGHGLDARVARQLADRTSRSRCKGAHRRQPERGAAAAVLLYETLRQRG